MAKAAEAESAARPIGRNTTFTLPVVVMLVFGVAGGVAAWQNIVHKIDSLITKIEALTEDRWGKLDDDMYMRAFVEANDLQGVPHVTYGESTP